MIASQASLTQQGKGGTREDITNNGWMDCRYYKGIVSWNDGALDRREGRKVVVEN